MFYREGDRQEYVNNYSSKLERGDRAQAQAMENRKENDSSVNSPLDL